ncbi:hypothetical protein L249_3246 [Ophiocordyceps polyrhachis-furcata BCC 54312]|uniref:Uncharacterized protein n=1 Tax=Ophiocordyceps polyrhachis-furcata BCC 54312 TaxID=1330021 RepID=A0A367LP30_9HYPO|nr:hypothetical protein L249_3246 [Ophiocordyceps polyrhachis-furcata BCC 54312]
MRLREVPSFARHAGSGLIPGRQRKAQGAVVPVIVVATGQWLALDRESSADQQVETGVRCNIPWYCNVTGGRGRQRTWVVWPGADRLRWGTGERGKGVGDFGLEPRSGVARESEHKGKYGYGVTAVGLPGWCDVVRYDDALLVFRNMHIRTGGIRTWRELTQGRRAGKAGKRAEMRRARLFPLLPY